MQLTAKTHNDLMDFGSALSHNSSSIVYSPLAAGLYMDNGHIDAVD